MSAFLGIGSTIIQNKEGKYTFSIHPTSGPWTEPIEKHIITCPKWFDTIEEAKTAGSAYLTVVGKELKKHSVKVHRQGDAHHRNCRGYPNCENDLDGCNVVIELRKVGVKI